jgi:RNA polymerase sigma factor (TIGR02999 family)
MVNQFYVPFRLHLPNAQQPPTWGHTARIELIDRRSGCDYPRQNLDERLPGPGTLRIDPVTRNITHLLKEWSDGDQQALDELTPLVYEELRQQAARYLRKERPNHSLQATALINEAFLRLIDVTDVQWQNRAHFFAIAAKLMRRILVDHARRRDAEKRGGSQVCLTLDEGVAWASEPDVDLLAIDEALDKLAIIDEQQARVVELRFFSGLTVEETATALGISPKTVKRDWSVARAWLKREIGE